MCLNIGIFSFPDDLGRAVEELVSVMTEEPNQTTAPPQYTNGKPAKEWPLSSQGADSGPMLPGHTRFITSGNTVVLPKILF